MANQILMQYFLSMDLLFKLSTSIEIYISWPSTFLLTSQLQLSKFVQASQVWEIFVRESDIIADFCRWLSLKLSTLVDVFLPANPSHFYHRCFQDPKSKIRSPRSVRFSTPVKSFFQLQADKLKLRLANGSSSSNFRNPTQNL